MPCPNIIKRRITAANHGRRGTAPAFFNPLENGRKQGGISKIKTSISLTKKSDINYLIKN
ncbi:hypothetical protein DYQ05_13110 [Treponema pedis]|nr:hypothetical protein DYQ05_13110 [Treponema pedis]